MSRVCGIPIVTTIIATLFAGIETSWAAPYEPENAAQNVNFNPEGNDPSKYFGKWPGHQYHPSPQDWRRHSVYQFITDRFLDGDPRNNTGRSGGYDLSRVDRRHGGDFRGIIERLDYIKSLGYTAIWISPIFQNRYNDYHGYNQIDYTLLDRRFGSLDDFRAMVDAAHARGMYVIVDIVVNHLADLHYFEGHRGRRAPFRLHDGEYRLFPHNPGDSYRDFRLDNTFYTEGRYPTVYGSDGFPNHDIWGTGSYWFSDFHHNGNLENYGDAWQNHMGKIYGLLDDLRTTHPRVQDKIIAMTKALISSTDIDGIRVDTPMQVPLYFFQRWAPAVRAHANSLGKDNFLIFGEFYCSRPRAATMTGRGKMPSQYGDPYAFIGNDYTMDGGINYRFYDWTYKALRNQDNHNLGLIKDSYDADLHAQDFFNPRRGEVRYRHLNFYNNHDQWRMASSPDGFAKTDLGSAVIAFWPGLPLLYYGDEQGFRTDNTAYEGWSREDMMTSTAWDALPTVNGRNPAEGDNFDMTSPHFRWVQLVMNVRRHYPALQNTDEVVERWVQTNDSNGIYAYSRIWGPEQHWAFVAFNTWRERLEAGGELGILNTGWDEGNVIVNVLRPEERYTLGPGGRLASLWLDPYETKVFVLEGNLQALDPVVTDVGPRHDTRADAGTVSVTLRFSEDMDEDSVKQAFRFNGQPVPAADLGWDASERRLTYTTTVGDGIHVVQLLESARSQAGETMYGTFRSRFRVGGQDNVIIRADALKGNTLTDDGLVEVVDADTGAAVLHHKATGASWVRIRIDQGNWSDWVAYQADMPWNLGADPSGRTVTAQYWADGSAAYFVKARIPGGDWKRTVVFIHGRTEVGQDMFIRGGIDHTYAREHLSRSCTAENKRCAVPIRHLNLRNAGTSPWKVGDRLLDWYGNESEQPVAAPGTPMDWTTNQWPSDWGPKATVAANGFGETLLNTWGNHYWMLDVEMDCAQTVGGWFEIKSYIANGSGWEDDVLQDNAPYESGNHFARCGHINVFRRGDKAFQVLPFPG